MEPASYEFLRALVEEGGPSGYEQPVQAIFRRQAASYGAKVEIDDEWLQRTYRERQEEFRIPAKAKVQEIVLPADKLSGQKARADVG